MTRNPAHYADAIHHLAWLVTDDHEGHQTEPPTALQLQLADIAEETRSGTWSTVRYALKMQRRTAIIWPSGRLEPRGPGAGEVLRG